MPDEITINEAASDRALDKTARWHDARPQAEKDAELARLKEIEAAIKARPERGGSRSGNPPKS
jgi:hypothetical protein